MCIYLQTFFSPNIEMVIEVKDIKKNVVSQNVIRDLAKVCLSILSRLPCRREALKENTAACVKRIEAKFMETI